MQLLFVLQKTFKLLFLNDFQSNGFNIKINFGNSVRHANNAINIANAVNSPK